MFSKRVRIFKWSVPVWGIVAALMIVTVAAAAFSYLINNALTSTAQPGLGISRRIAIDCSMVSGPGTFVCDDTDVQNITMTASGYDNDSVARAILEYEISVGESGTFAVACSDDLAAENVVVSYAQDCNSGAHTPGSNLSMEIGLDYSSAQPDDSFTGSISVEFTREP